jgi:hypothetical protein
VNECERRLRSKDLGSCQRDGGRGDGLLIQLGNRRDKGQVDAIPEDGDRLGDRSRVARQPPQPPEHSLRNRSGREICHEPCLLPLRRRSIERQCVQQLPDQQRVTASRLHARSREGRIGVVTER